MNERIKLITHFLRQLMSSLQAILPPRDVERIDHIDLNRKYKARDLLNILRARTFSPYESAYVEINGKKVFVRVKLEEDE